MSAIVHVTDVVEGARISLDGAKLVPVLPTLVRVPVDGAKPGDQVYVLVKGTVQAIIPG